MNHDWTMKRLLAVIVCLIGVTPVAFAQNADDESADVFTKVYRIQHGNAKKIAEALAQLDMTYDVVAESSTNCIIAHIGAAELAAVEDVISALDQPQSADPSMKTIFTYVANRDADEVASLVNRVLNFGNLRVGVDDANNMLVLSGPSTQLDAAENLIKQVDKPQGVVGLSFFFIQGTIGTSGGGTGGNAGVALPESLREVGAALRQSGFADVRLLAPLRTQVNEGRHFITSGYMGSANDDGLSFQIEGNMSEGSGESMSRIEVNSNVRYGDTTLFEVETTVSATVGDYVVLAAAPASPRGKEAIALVVHVDRPGAR